MTASAARATTTRRTTIDRTFTRPAHPTVRHLLRGSREARLNQTGAAGGGDEARPIYISGAVAAKKRGPRWTAQEGTSLRPSSSVAPRKPPPGVDNSAARHRHHPRRPGGLKG